MAALELSEKRQEDMNPPEARVRRDRGYRKRNFDHMTNIWYARKNKKPHLSGHVFELIKQGKIAG